MTSDSNFKPAENKREEFRKYLEKTGVMNALTKVLVALYEEAEKPENALQYICNKLSSYVDGETIEHIKAELEEANNKISELEKENAVLKGDEIPSAPVVDPDELALDEAPLEASPVVDAE